MPRMTDESSENPGIPERLQQIVVGLRQMGRKCRTLADRHPDFPELATRFGTLADAIENDHEQVDFAAAARSIEPAVTLFETAGFMTVAREAGRIRNQLAGEAPEPMGEVVVGNRRIFSASTARRDEDGAGPAAVIVDLDADRPDATDSGLGRTILLLSAILIVAVSVAGLMVHRSLERMEVERKARLEVAPATPTPTPVPPRPTATRVPLDADGLERAREFADSIAAARLALVAGDHPAAIQNLWSAARIDRDHASTVAVAERIVEAPHRAIGVRGFPGALAGGRGDPVHRQGSGRQFRSRPGTHRRRGPAP
jgi:hypothetical protein